ncbi:MAG TPA: aminotransferase class IV [Phycisphaerae bacterium]|nr:aminotransferase class IV [Phycisphaerae bacterium]HNU45819.1 aminotransferase class IV [Phycisphaerae bacterium]
MTRTVWFNGEFLPATQAHIDIDDGGWLHGAGLFETMRAEHGTVFRLEAHLARLMRSAEKLLSPIPLDALPGRAALEQLLRQNDLSMARLRLTVSAGPLREDEGEDGPRLAVAATALPLAPPAERLYERGVRVLISPYRQCTTDPTAGHKTTCYLPRLLALRAAQQAGCQEALWFTEFNHVAEGSISNVFVVREGVLRTPPIETPVLPGIARAAVLALAGEQGVTTQEQPLSVNDLLDADEVFLTNVMMQAMPVVAVERRDIKAGKVGALTRSLRTAFQRLVEKECTQHG